MEVINNLLRGFLSASTPYHLLICFFGALVGTVVGVLPGIGPTAAMALLLPLSFTLSPTASLILLAGIYYGSMYGGSTTSILLNMPGEAASAITCVDGYKMAKKGRGGAALAVAAIGSWVAGTVAIVGLMLFAPPLSKFALMFGPQEYFGLAVLGLLLLNNLTGGSFIKSTFLMIVGLMLGTVGIEISSGYSRFTFGVLELFEGVDLIPVLMGVFGLAEILETVRSKPENLQVMKVKFRDLYPTKSELKRSFWPIVRGTLIGFPIGLLPGPSGTLSSFAAYKLEKAVSPAKDELGEGAIEGVAAPEAANNAASTASMVPLFALGLPFAPPVAILLSGLMINGIAPGPLFMTQHADIFWAVIASMYIGNVMLIVLNLPLVGVFASLIKTPPKILMPIISAIMLIGVYSLNNSLFDIAILLVFGLLGCYMKQHGYEPAPLVIGLVLGSFLEESLLQGLAIMDGNFFAFFTRPISAVLLGLASIVLLWGLFGGLIQKLMAKGIKGRRCAA
jgi:putative tricarboxylic transport membrane protein